MVGALAGALAGAGHDVRIVTPLYRGIREKFPAITRADWQFDLPLGGRRAKGALYELELKPGAKVFFVDQPEYFDRPGIYGEAHHAYADNAERYIFFSKCVVHLARFMPWRPDVVHIHDWQVGLVPALLLQEKTEGWGTPPPTCLTIHNLAYQGVFPAAAFKLTNLSPSFFNHEGLEFFELMNCLKAGIAYSDFITTVSPRYAREITTEEFGCGLDGMLRRRQKDLAGILNGVDYSEWNTTNNPLLYKPFSINRMAGKAVNKAELQKCVGLPVDPEIPLFGTIARLAEQKGVDIQLGALAEMLNTRMQFVLLGSGSAEYERGYRELARRFPEKVSARFGFDEKLSHQIEAGSDFFLMPSRFEPCGLNQMYSLRYGTIPIVRAVGGLDDSVVDWAQDAQGATGIKFSEYSSRALARAIRKALVLYSQPKLFKLCRRNAMKADFSWDKTVHEFVRIYKQISRS
jgi:starch synthase